MDENVIEADAGFMLLLEENVPDSDERASFNAMWMSLREAQRVEGWTSTEDLDTRERLLALGIWIGGHCGA